ncbi:MAG: shikimate dehydrogenase [Clostridia bacterium]|nr:shikimate dehydrogenase [Clostridia bacterium]
MLKLAVIGKDVSKSLSPEMHRFILKRMGYECEYEKISLSKEELERSGEELFTRYDGFNATIPHKQNILPFLKKLEGDARVFGAVNTVVTKTRTGYNTDGAGFLTMLEEAGFSVQGKRALVLGAGGAGRSCIYALNEAGAEVTAYERDEERLNAVYRDFKDFTPKTALNTFEFDFIVNCSGIGMHDTVGKTPFVPDERGADCVLRLLDNCSAAVDLIYEPKESELLRLARERKKRTLNGEAMLFFQAYVADCIYTNTERDMKFAKKLWKEYGEEHS